MGAEKRKVESIDRQYDYCRPFHPFPPSFGGHWPPFIRRVGGWIFTSEIISRLLCGGPGNGGRGLFPAHRCRESYIGGQDQALSSLPTMLITRLDCRLKHPLPFKNFTPNFENDDSGLEVNMLFR